MNKEIEDIKWFRTNKPLDEIKINILSNLPFKLPEIYISLLKDSDGGSPNNSDFQYYDCHRFGILSYHRLEIVKTIIIYLWIVYIYIYIYIDYKCEQASTYRSSQTRLDDTNK
jgi:hypothetical protein